MIAVDTSVLVRAHRRELPLHDECGAWLRRLVGGASAWALPVFCVGEFVRVVTHPRVFKQPSTLAEAVEARDALTEQPTTRVISPGLDFTAITQDTDNGYSVFEQSLLRYIAAGLGVSYEQLSRNYAQMSYSTARASANESWAYFMGRRKFVASRQASQMFLCWLEEAIVRRVVTLPSKARFSFQEARSAWGNCDWIGSGRMAIDGLKEVQEAVMLIEAGLSTYEKECAKRGDDYQEIFAQQVRETMERRAAGLKPPAWAAAAFESGLRQSTEEEKSDSRAA